MGLALGRIRGTAVAHPTAIAVGLIVAAAALVRLAFMFRTPVFLLHDSGSYYLPAHDLVYGEGFDLSVRRTPVYPWFLAATIAYFGEELEGVALAQHLLGVASAVLVYVLGRLTFGAAAGLAAGLLTALDGTLLVSEHYIMPEALLLFLLLLTFITACGALRAESAPLFVLAGALLGVSSLCKPVAQALLPVVPFAALVTYRSWRRAAATGALVVVGFGLVSLPWMARNLLEHGSLTTAGALGQTLVARTAKHDTGFRYYDSRFEDRYGDRDEVAARQIVQSGIRQRLSDGVIYRRVQDRLHLSDAEINVFMRDLALEVIAERPLYYLQGTAKMTWQLLVGEVEKLRTDWKSQNARLSRDEWEERIEHLLARPSPIHHNEFDRADLVVGIYQPGAFGPLLPLLALAGLAWAARGSPPRWALIPGLAALALVVTSAALDGPVARYRYPADPLIALTAAGGTLALLSWLGAIGRAVGGSRWLSPRSDQWGWGALIAGRLRRERGSSQVPSGTGPA